MAKPKSKWQVSGHAVLSDGTEVPFPAGEYRDRVGCWDFVREIGNDGFMISGADSDLAGTFIPAHRIKEISYSVTEVTH